jgi:hypothetical protein
MPKRALPGKRPEITLDQNASIPLYGIVNLKISVVELSPFPPHFAGGFGENDP